MYEIVRDAVLIDIKVLLGLLSQQVMRPPTPTVVNHGQSTAHSLEPQRRRIGVLLVPVSISKDKSV